MPQPFIPLPEGAQVEIVQVVADDSIAVNRLWFRRRTGSPTEENLQQLADGVAAWHTAQVLPYLSDQVTRTIVRARSWVSFVGAPQYANLTTAVGGVASPAQSANVSLRVRFLADGPPRGFYNSNFVGGLPQSGVETNRLGLALVDAIFEAYVSVIDLAAVWGPFPAWRWVCTSRRAGNAWRDVQFYRPAGIIEVPSPFVSPRRRRLPRAPSP